MPCAEASVSARQVGVDGVIPVGHGRRDHLADLGEDGAGLVAVPRSRAQVRQAGVDGEARPDVCAARLRVLGVRRLVAGAAHSLIEGVDPTLLVLSVAGPAGAPEDGSHCRGAAGLLREHRTAVVEQVGRTAAMRLRLSARPMDSRHRRLGLTAIRPVFQIGRRGVDRLGAAASRDCGQEDHCEMLHCFFPLDANGRLAGCADYDTLARPRTSAIRPLPVPSSSCRRHSRSGQLEAAATASR